MQLPITIGLHRSRFIDGVLLLVLLLVLVAGLLLPGHSPWSAGILLLGGLSGALAWRGLRPQVEALRLLADGGLEIRRVAETAFVAVETEPGVLLHPALLVARLRAADGRRALLTLTVDSLSREDFRRLRVFLRWRGGAA